MSGIVAQVTEQPEPQDDAAVADDPNQLDDIEYVSKSQLKRDSKALQALGKKIATFNDEQLASLQLDSKLHDAILLARKLGNKRGALKRHFQYIGKLLRSMDAEPIIDAVARIEQHDHASHQRFHQVERWRDRVVTEGESAINEFCAQHPETDRQRLRQLWRNHQRVAEHKQAAVARQIFQDLRVVLEKDE
jgi:ribosome-associated protein